MVAGGDVATVWELDETQALPHWRRIGLQACVPSIQIRRTRS